MATVMFVVIRDYPGQRLDVLDALIGSLGTHQIDDAEIEQMVLAGKSREVAIRRLGRPIADKLVDAHDAGKSEEAAKIGTHRVRLEAVEVNQ